MAKQIIKAAGYIRVSSSVQIYGESLATQKKQIKNYCRSKEWKLVEIYEDHGFSGSTVKRPAFQSMMEDAKQGNFQRVVIRDLSRAARHNRELLNVTADLKQHHVLIAAVKEDLDFSGPHGELLLSVLGSLAEFERKINDERMKESKYALWSKGSTFIGKPPYGYTWNKKEKLLEINPEEAEIYNRIVNMYLDEGLSMKAIALRLSNEGIKCKRAKFSSPVISYMLKNPAYYGNYILNKQKYKYNPETGRHNRTKKEKPTRQHIRFKIPDIIDKNTWDRIQEKTKSNKVKSKRNSKISEPYWLRDILRCGLCGGKVKAHHGSKRKDGTFPRYYSCYWSTAGPQTLALANKTGKCSLPTIKAAKIEKRVWFRITDRMGLTLSGIKGHAKHGRGKWRKGENDGVTVLLDGYESPLKNFEEQQKRIKTELNTLNRQRRNLFKMSKDDRFDIDEMASKLQQNSNEILDTEARLREVEEKISDLNEFAENRKFFAEFARDNKDALSKVREEMDALSPEHKKIIIESITPEILITPLDKKNTAWESMKFKSWNVKKQVFYRLAEEGALPTLKVILNKNGANDPAAHILCRGIGNH